MRGMTKQEKEQFVDLLNKTTGLQWVPEFFFAKGECNIKRYNKRMWHIDFACVNEKIALEVEGGVFAKGRHTRPLGFLGDMVKYNALAVFGWRLLRYPAHLIWEQNTLASIDEDVKYMITLNQRNNYGNE